jgi:small subunit ribosomal protein S20
MPIKQAAMKRLRADKKRRTRNKSAVAKLKTLVKEFAALCDARKIEEAKNFLRSVNKYLDHSAGKKIVHKNFASRKKSRLQKKLNKLLTSA